MHHGTPMWMHWSVQGTRPTGPCKPEMVFSCFLLGPAQLPLTDPHNWITAILTGTKLILSSAVSYYDPPRVLLSVIDKMSLVPVLHTVPTTRLYINYKDCICVSVKSMHHRFALCVCVWVCARARACTTCVCQSNRVPCAVCSLSARMYTYVHCKMFVKFVAWMSVWVKAVILEIKVKCKLSLSVELLLFFFFIQPVERRRFSRQRCRSWVRSWSGYVAFLLFILTVIYCFCGPVPINVLPWDCNLFTGSSSGDRKPSEHLIILVLHYRFFFFFFFYSFTQILCSALQVL